MARDLRFEWDPAKGSVNLRCLGVSFSEATSVFLDEHAILIFRPRGAPDPGATPRRRVHRDDANTNRPPARQVDPVMSLLPQTDQQRVSRPS